MSFLTDQLQAAFRCHQTPDPGWGLIKTNSNVHDPGRHWAFVETIQIWYQVRWHLSGMATFDESSTYICETHSVSPEEPTNDFSWALPTASLRILLQKYMPIYCDGEIWMHQYPTANHLDLRRLTQKKYVRSRGQVIIFCIYYRIQRDAITHPCPRCPFLAPSSS